MRTLKAALLFLVATGCIAFACEPKGKETSVVSPAPADPVVDANGFIIRPWSPLTPEQIRVINQGRKAHGVAKGEVPGF